MIGSNKVLFPRNGLSVIDPLKMLDIQGGIFHWQVINSLIKSNMGVHFDSVGEYKFKCGLDLRSDCLVKGL